MNKKFKIVTLGCRVNQYESEKIQAGLKMLGWEKAGFSEKADLIIINTCSVTKSAVKKSVYQLKSVLRKGICADSGKIVITGCAAQSDKQVFEKISSLLNLKKSNQINLQIVPQTKKEQIIKEIFPQSLQKSFTILKQFSNHTRAFVKVQDGCNQFCSYCIIPHIRGRSVSRDFKRVIAEISSFVDHGFKEIVLTGIDLGDYKDLKNKKDLADLIKAAALIPNLQRLRLSSIGPNDLSEKLINELLHNSKLMPSLHLSLQSGSNRVLKKMRRNYTAEFFWQKVQSLKTSLKNFAFTTDLIVGFPSETEDDFQKSMQIIEQVGFVKVHIFPFSVRPKTLAAKAKDFVGMQEIKRRVKIAKQIAEKTANLQKTAFINKCCQVLVEEQKDFGYNEHFLKVKLLAKAEKNQLIKTKIVQNNEKYLIGRKIF